MAGFVPDASLTLTWCFEDEATPATDSLLKRLKDGDEALVPAHWAMEVTNGLLMAVRRKRITDEKVRRFIDDLIALPIRIDSESPLAFSKAVLDIGQQHGLRRFRRDSSITDRILISDFRGSIRLKL